MLFRRSRPLPRRDLNRQTFILAPHPDDEVLGCGGAIARMRRLGTPVRIVFLTDGADSHAQFMTRSRLTSIRRREAREAAVVLGVPPESLTFLDFPDGSLSDHERSVVARVTELVRRHEPEQVFLPSRLEPTRDHRAAHRAILLALEDSSPSIRVYEYPIWAWLHWPWTSLPIEPLTDAVKRTLLTAFGGRVLRDLRWRIPIQDVLDTKRAALECHQSQMLRPDGNDDWRTLPDIAGGSFLRCFFQESEFFCRRRRGFRLEGAPSDC
ncbi:MAG: PIG-L deacetylase family protein [Thermoanaerobaculia bacterium]